MCSRGSNCYTHLTREQQLVDIALLSRPQLHSAQPRLSELLLKCVDGFSFKQALHSFFFAVLFSTNIVIHLSTCRSGALLCTMHSVYYVIRPCILSISHGHTPFSFLQLFCQSTLSKNLPPSQYNHYISSK